MNQIIVPIKIEIEVVFKEKQNNTSKQKVQVGKAQDTNKRKEERDDATNSQSKLCKCGRPLRHRGSCKGVKYKQGYSKLESAKNNPEYAKKLIKDEEYMKKAREEYSADEEEDE